MHYNFHSGEMHCSPVHKDGRKRKKLEGGLVSAADVLTSHGLTPEKEQARVFPQDAISVEPIHQLLFVCVFDRLLSH